MKKLLTSIFLSLLLTGSALAATQNFTDLSPEHPNYQAITFLQAENIISGYADGTFKPEQSLNRAEFLRIILDGSNISLNALEQTPFLDVNHSEWYAPYVQKAYKEGWVIGYSDNTFRPTQGINKVEALKILGEVQAWQLKEVTEQPFTDIYKTAWHAKYVQFAKQNKFLEEAGSKFEPEKLMTRAKISEIIYRTITNSPPTEEENSKHSTPSNDSETAADTETSAEEKTEDSPSSQPQEPEEEEEAVTFLITKFSTISEDFFTDINLAAALPSHFYKNEVYLFEGELKSTEHEHATVILGYPNKELSPKSFSANIDKNNQFSIPVYFDETGIYNLGIIPGNEGQSIAFQISVLPELPAAGTSQYSQAPSSLEVVFENQETKLNFSPTTENSIKKFHFTQGNKKFTYMSRQDISSLPLRYKDFKDFSEGSIYYKIEAAGLSNNGPLKIETEFDSSSKQKFKATTHTFSAINYEKISTTIPDTLESAGDIEIDGTLLEDAKTKAYSIKPDGFVDEVTLESSSTPTSYFNNEILTANSDFSFNYEAKEEGTHIIEINDKNGLAIVNHPIYIGDKIPLIPDYLDIHERDFFEEELNLFKLRKEMLALINEAREELGLNSIKLSNELNDLAQDHSNDMAINDYFSHINLSNQTPNQRSQAAGINTVVGENIAKDVSIRFAHEGLMRSAGHRDNILNPNWERVGIGISLANGYLFISQEFSTTPITEATLESYKEELLTEINSTREASSLPPINHNNNLDNVAKTLNQESISTDSSITNEQFSAALQAENFGGSSQAVGRTFNIWNEMLQSILEEESFISEAWENIGIDIQLDNSGHIHLLIIINNP